MELSMPDVEANDVVAVIIADPELWAERHRVADHCAE